MSTIVKRKKDLEILKNVLKQSYNTKTLYQYLIMNANSDEVNQLIQSKIDLLSTFIYENLLKLNAVQAEDVVKQDYSIKFKCNLLKIKCLFLKLNDVTIINESIKIDVALHNLFSKSMHKITYSEDIVEVLKEQTNAMHEMIQMNEYSNLFTTS